VETTDPDSASAKPKRGLSRRHFLRIAAIGTCSALAGGSYTIVEAGWINQTDITILVPRLPNAWKGLRVAFLTDIHHGPWTSLAYVHTIVERANALKPDLILLGGDYVHRGASYIQPCIAALGILSAPLGVFGVLGNHDHWHGAAETSEAFRDSGIHELTNSGIFLVRGEQRLRIAGVGDLWEDTQDITAALGDTKPNETAILLSHNPDYAEQISDSRVGLVLSGHTHGGQVVLPVVGAPFVPSRFGQKYLRGLVQAPHIQVFVSRGLGTITPPVRFCCRPEINLITLA
jgi:uncharacterized protein